MENVTNLLLDGTGLELWSFILLCGVSFAGSFVTTAFGLGGGILNLAAMALFMSPAVLVPLHGVVQLGANCGRAALMYRHALTVLLPVFLIGTIVGATVGGQLVVALPLHILQSILALFILYSVWGPKFQARKPSRKAFFGIGAFGAFTTMFVGATGPLIAPFVIAASKDRQQFVATHAMLMTLQHTLKLITFGLLGFAFGSYIPLLVGLLVFGFAGTYIGKLALNRLPEPVFRVILKTVLTLIAARLLFSAARAALA